MKSRKSMKVSEIETQHPEAIAPEAEVMRAAQIMKRLDVGSLPVCEGDVLIGLITDRDITIRSTAEGRDPRQTKVRDIMSPDPVCCYENQDIAECVELMERKQIRRLPVIDRGQRLVGIVSLGDLAIRSQNERLAGEVLNRVSAQPVPVTTS
jgi:CBS domain-containing protein